MGNKKRKKGKRRSEEENFGRSGYDEILDEERFKPLRKLPSYVGYREDTGKVLYSHSDSRTWIDLSPAQKLQIRSSPHGIFLISFAFLLCAWFITSFIYRIVTEADKGSVALSMLPSLIIIGVCVAILLLSFFGGWGSVVRWAYRHNLVRGGDAASGQWHKNMEAEINRADLYKVYECALEVTEKFVTFWLYGQIYTFRREAVSLKVKKVYDNLHMFFSIDGFGFEFPRYDVNKKQYVYLKKLFADKFEIIRTQSENKFDRKKLIKEIPFILAGLAFVAASVTMIVAHYVWIPEIPPFIGVFFLLMSGLVICNIFSEIPLVDEAGVPFCASFVLIVIPPWAYVWIEQAVCGNRISFLHLITHCTPLAAGFGFFWVLGFYVLSFAVSKAADYIRFGRS